MPSCPSCGAERVASAKNAPCAAVRRSSAASALARRSRRRPRRRGLPDFELDVPKRPAPKAAAPRKVEEEVKLELAVEPRSFAPVVADRDSNAVTPSSPLRRSILREAHEPTSRSASGDVAFDARLLADYGDAAEALAPLAALRVARAHAASASCARGSPGRREEAKRAANEVEDALVAFAERMRPVAEKHGEFARSVEELRGAEDVLRSRDRVLASEQDAQTARLAAVDARLAKLEAELAHAQAEERSDRRRAGVGPGSARARRVEAPARRVRASIRAAARGGRVARHDDDVDARRRSARLPRPRAHRHGAAGQVEARRSPRHRRDGRGLRGDPPQRQARGRQDAPPRVQPRRGGPHALSPGGVRGEHDPARRGGQRPRRRPRAGRVGVHRHGDAGGRDGRAALGARRTAVAGRRRARGSPSSSSTCSSPRTPRASCIATSSPRTSS